MGYNYDLLTQSVNDPNISSSTYARGWLDGYVYEYDDRYVISVNIGAEVQQSAQQGLRATGFVNSPQGVNVPGSPWSATGVTNNYTSSWQSVINTGTHDFTIYRTGSDQPVRIGVRIEGETVSGYGPMRMAGGSAMHVLKNSDNPDGSAGIVVPKLALPSKPASASLSSAPVGGNAAGSCAASTGVGVTYDFYLDKNGSDVASKLGVSNSCTFTGYTVLGNTRYRVRALAKNASGSSGAVNSSWVYTAPAAPSGLSASSSGTTVNLSWSNTTFAATSTEIQRSTDGSNWVTIYPAGVVSSFIDTSAPSGTVYYRVRNTATGGTTNWSNTAQATTMQPPAAPDNISSIRNSDYQNTITWVNHPTSAAPYGGVRVKRSDNDGAYVEVAAAVVESYVDTDTEPDHWYRYKISAYNGAGESSETVGATLRNSVAVPVALSVQTTKDLREPSMQVTFDPNTNYASYPSAIKRVEFQLSEDNGANWSPLGEAATSPFKFTVLYDEVLVKIRMRNKITISGTEYYSDWVTTETYTNELIPLPPEFVAVQDGYVYVGVPLDVDSVSRDIEIFQSVNHSAWELYDTLTVTSEDQTFAIPMDTIAQTLDIRARVSTQWGDSIFTDGETVIMGNRPTVDGDIMLAKVITESSSTDTIVRII